MLRKGPPRGPRPSGPPPEALLAKARQQQLQQQQPPPLSSAPPPTAATTNTPSSVAVSDQDHQAHADTIVAAIPKGKKKVQGYVRTIGVELAVSKAAHASLEAENKALKRERDELREDFDALNEDFQTVRHDVAKAEKKADEHLDSVKEMHGDNKEILDSNEALRTLATIAFKGLIEIEDTLVIATKINKKTSNTGGSGGKARIKSTKEKEKDVKDTVANINASITYLRNLKIKLRESLLAMNVDIFSQEEKDMMELVKDAGDDAGKAATKMQSQFRGKQARAEYREKREAATKVQSQIRGVNARKNKPNNGAKAKEKTTNGEKAGEINARNTRSNDKLKKTIVQLEKELKLAQDQIDELNEKMTGYVCGVLCCVVCVCFDVETYLTVCLLPLFYFVFVVVVRFVRFVQKNNIARHWVFEKIIEREPRAMH